MFGTGDGVGRDVLLTPGEGPGWPLAPFRAQRECQHWGTEIEFVSRSLGNGRSSLGVTGSLAVGGKELISLWVGKARNWVWVK